MRTPGEWGTPRHGSGGVVESGAAGAPLLGPRAERERLRALAGVRVGAPGTDPEFYAAARVAARLAGTSCAAVTFVAREHERVKASFGCDLADVPRETAFGEEVVATGAPLV